MPNDDELNNDSTETNIDDAPAGEQTPVVPIAPSGRPNFADMTPRERQLVQAARTEEKNKLYKEQQRTKEENERLQQQLRAAQTAPIPTTTAGIDAQNERIERLMEMVEAQGRQMSEMRETEMVRRHESELRAYAANAIATMRGNGEDVIEALVGGSNENEIDESLMVARAEYQRVVMLEEDKRTRAASRSGARPVTVQANGGRPAGTPRPLAPNMVEADDHESISDITSDAAVRDGSWEKNRTKVLGKLRRGFRYQSAVQQ